MKSIINQTVVLIATLLSACATTGELPPDSAFPTLNAESLQVCGSLQNHDFAFTSSADGANQIYLYQSRTASIVKVTDDDADNHWATWSEDGRMLAFQSTRGEERDVLIKVMPDGEAVNLSQHIEQDLVPSWSPNGKYIVFYSSRDVTWPGTGPIGGHLYVMRVQGSALGRIQTEPFVSPSMIAWSPDSTTLFYARYGAGKEGIYALDLQSGQEAALLALQDRYPGIASTNPAAGTVDYNVSTNDGVVIYQLSLADGLSRRLSPEGGHHFYANWSPDRSDLLITTAQDAARQLYDIRCVAADGSYDVAVIDDLTDARSAVWRPSGR
ncbi:MAG: hypothetical protein QNJ23_00920 [Woeseiaceae bacterium]|nr:hypothetical protein [Woeseiaceae bacterium]